MRVIVTRPASQAAEWVAQLQARGVDAVALPLIGIVPAPDAGAVHAAWWAIAKHHLVVMVSPNAAEQFFALRPAGAAWPETTLVASPGPGTTQVLIELGVPPALIVAPAADAPQFDSEALWAQLSMRAWRGASVLIVRGEGGRDWLADTLRAQGAEVSCLAAYQRAAPAFMPDQHALLQQAISSPQAHLWFFSSSEAVDNLGAATAGADWSRSLALATHPRIVARARQLGFERVAESRPTLDAVWACIQSLAP